MKYNREIINRIVLPSLFAVCLVTPALTQDNQKRSRVAKVEVSQNEKQDKNAKPTPTPTPETKTTVEPETTKEVKIEPSTETKTVTEVKTVEPTQDDKTSPKPTDDKQIRQEQDSEEEAAILPYYNNYLKNYYLGPEDVISVEVFAQCPNYCKGNITIPPNGKISYPLIREGVFVAGKTVEQVADEITKKLDEYIIDPKVTVSLDKAMSARYSVLGDVGSPGVRIMSRRVSLLEAIAEAGGIARTGDKSKIMILRRDANNLLKPIYVNLKDIERGKNLEVPYLAPGDQVFVPGNKIKFLDRVLQYASVLSFGRMFVGSPF